MKHLLLLIILFTTACFAQNVKVTAYRLVHDHEDGPCSVKTYVENPLMSYQTYVTAESDDSIFAENLLKLKKEARKWRKTDYFCSARVIGGSMIHNMFVISYNGVNDTILSTLYNDMIIFPGEEKAYSDKKEVLKKMLPRNITEFFKHDFRSQIRSLYFPEENDSITSDKILYQEKHAIKIFNKDFEKDTGKFKLVNRDSLYNDIEREYAFNNDTIFFHEDDIKITITNPDSGWNVGGLKVGDTEELLKSKYPESTKIQKYSLIRYEDIQRQYFYWVILKEKKGNITYFIKDHLIEKIKIYYR